jgi:hypothetical protein
MRKLFIICAIAAPCAAFSACSDDDGSDVLPNGPPGSGGSAGTSASPDAGPGGSGAGRAGSSGAGGGSAGSGGSAGCTVTPAPDAGVDAGADAGELDAGGADASSDAGTSALGPVSFAADIHPIFEASCGPCHVTDGSAGHNVGGEIGQAYLDAVRIGQRLVTRIDGGGMPPSYAPPPNDCGNAGGDQPGDPGCLTVNEVALVQAWINQCFPP